MLLIFPLAAASGFVIVILKDNSRESLYSLFFSVPVMIAIMSFSMVRNMKRHRKAFESYRLLIEPGSVTRIEEGSPLLKIYREDIVSIEKTYTGGYVIKGKGPLNTILVPPQMQHPADLENALRQLHSLTAKSSNAFLSKATIPLSLLSIVSMIGILASDDKRILITCALVFYPIQIWAVVSMIRNGNKSAQTIIAIIVLLVMIIGVSINFFMRLSGNDF